MSPDPEPDPPTMRQLRWPPPVSGRDSGDSASARFWLSKRTALPPRSGGKQPSAPICSRRRTFPWAGLLDAGRRSAVGERGGALPRRSGVSGQHPLPAGGPVGPKVLNWPELRLSPARPSGFGRLTQRVRQVRTTAFPSLRACRPACARCPRPDRPRGAIAGGCRQRPRSGVGCCRCGVLSGWSHRSHSVFP